jgi:hypothetical protein
MKRLLLLYHSFLQAGGRRECRWIVEVVATSQQLPQVQMKSKEALQIPPGVCPTLIAVEASNPTPHCVTSVF